MSNYSSDELNRWTLQSQKVWHTKDLAFELGNIYPGAIPIADVRSRLFNWEAQLLPVYAGELEAGGGYEIEGRVAVVRPAGARDEEDPGEVLSVPTTEYAIHQYGKTLVDAVEELVGSSENELDVFSAGCLGGGRQAWVQVTVPETLRTKEDVEFRPNLLAVSSLDQSWATTYKRTILDAVCDNTTTAALSEAGAEYKVKHLKGSEARLLDAAQALGLFAGIEAEFRAMVKALTAKKIDAPVFDAFLEVFAPTQVKGVLKDGPSLTQARNKQDQLRHLWKHDMRVAPWAGTVYGVVKAVNTHRHHYATVRGAQREDRNVELACSGGFDKLDRWTVATLDALT